MSPKLSQSLKQTQSLMITPPMMLFTLFWFNAPLHLLDRMAERRVDLDAAVFNAAINACAKAGDVATAEGFLSKLQEAGLRPNVVSYTAVISACAK